MNTANWRTLCFGLGMLALGFLAGTGGWLNGLLVVAQESGSGPSSPTVAKIRSAHAALKEAMESLKTEGRYDALTDAPNVFLILSGGGSARQDLESGRGVDPETFAALYANQVIPEIQEQLGRDEQGRITFNGEVVRLYSRSRLERMFADRLRMSEVGKE